MFMSLTGGFQSSSNAQYRHMIMVAADFDAVCMYTMGIVDGWTFYVAVGGTLQIITRASILC